MREFFRGWRRKVGVVTLVMALVITGLWVRTLFFADQLRFFIGDRTNLLISLRSGFCWLSIDTSFPATKWTTDRMEDIQEVYGHEPLPQIVDELIAKHTASKLHPACRYLLYWWLTLPLTLLSAYLILWKPRKRMNGDA